MKYELTKSDLEEIALCIVQCGLPEDKACEYIVDVAREKMNSDVSEVENETHDHKRLEVARV